jgi:hypothetical protein
MYALWPPELILPVLFVLACVCGCAFACIFLCTGILGSVRACICVRVQVHVRLPLSVSTRIMHF